MHEPMPSTSVLIQSGIQQRTIWSWTSASLQEKADVLTEEAPLEIRLVYGPAQQRRSTPIAITMRTPGDDIDLALGFLFTEAIIGRAAEVVSAVPHPADGQVVVVELCPEVQVDTSGLDRHFYTTSSCGVCGKASLERVRSVSCYYPQPALPLVSAATLAGLPECLQEQQALFTLTGGIHAAALFQPDGRLLRLCEDVGRHNAVDKLLGAALAAEELPLREHVLLLSGRISFELVQKAAMAGIPIIAAVGAPSSLAVDLAEEHDMTVVGFVRPERMNIYCGRERILS